MYCRLKYFWSNWVNNCTQVTECSQLYSWSINNDTSTLVTECSLQYSWSTIGGPQAVVLSELKCVQYDESICVVVSSHFSISKDSLSPYKKRLVDKS